MATGFGRTHGGGIYLLLDCVGSSRHSRTRLLRLLALSVLQGEDVEIMTSEDAAYFPIYASCALFSMFLLFKFVGPEYVNLVLGAYFFALGTMSLTSALRPVGLLIVPADYLGEPYHFELTQKAPAAAEGDGAEKKGDAEAEAPKDILHFELSFDNADLACLFMSACVGVWYLCTKVSGNERSVFATLLRVMCRASSGSP